MRITKCFFENPCSKDGLNVDQINTVVRIDPSSDAVIFRALSSSV